MLQRTSPTGAKNLANRRSTLGGRLKNFHQFPLGPTFVFLGDPSDDDIPGNGVIHEYTLTLAMQHSGSAGTDTLHRCGKKCTNYHVFGVYHDCNNNPIGSTINL
jgi:hypothetical protein